MADPAGQVRVINPDGDPVFIPASQLQNALENQDYELPPDPNDTAANAARSFGEGLAQGFLPGAPKILAGAFPQSESIEQQKIHQQVAPILHGAGFGVGAVGQGVALGAATGGLGDLLEAGRVVAPTVEAASDVLKGGDVLGAVTKAGATPGAIEGATDAAAKLGPQTIDQVKNSSAALPYIQQAVAGGGYGATNYTNEAQLGDHSFNGEGLAQSIGLNMIGGALGEGAINLLGKSVLPPVLDKAGDLLDTAGNAAKNAFVKAAEYVNPEAKGKIGPAFDAIMNNARELPETEFKSFGDNINDLVHGMDDAGQAHFNKFQPEEAAQMVKDVGAEGVRAAVGKVADGIDQQLGVIKNNIAGGAAGYSDKKAFGSIANSMDQWKSIIADPESTTADILQATRQARRDVDASGIFGRSTDDALTTDLKTAVRGPLRDTLNDAGIWGQEAAGRNADVNKTFSEWLNAGKNAFGDLGKKEWNEFGQKEWSADPAKIRNLFTGDQLAKDTKLQHLNDYIDKSKAYLDEIKKSAGNAGAVVPGGSDLEDLLKTITAQKQAAQAYAPISALERALPRGGGESVGGLGVLGYGAHALGLSVPGAGAVTAAYAGLKNPVQTMRMFAKISGAAEKAQSLITSGVRKVFASEPARNAVQASLRGLTIKSVNGASAGSDFAKQAAHITQLAGDTTRQMKNLSENTSELTNAAPNTSLAAQTASVRALQLLAQNIPKNPTPSMLPSENKEWKPNDSQLQAWDELHQAIADPPSYLQRLANGTADPTIWPQLQQAYPAWTAQVQKSTIDHITSHPKLEMDPTQAMTASMILGSPVSPTVAPEQVSFQQQYYQAMAGAPAMKPRAKGLDKIDLGSRSAPGHQRSK